MTTAPLRPSLTALLLGVGLAACRTAPDVTPRPIPGGVPQAASEAVLRAVVAGNGAALGGQSMASCIGIGQRPALADPDPALLARLADLRPAVRPASACRAGERAVEAATGRPALIFHVEPLGCATADRCTVRAGYYEGNLGASDGAYEALREGAGWTVRPVGPQAIS